MTEHRPIRARGSLLERAAEVYDFAAAFNGASPTQAADIPSAFSPVAAPAPIRAAASSVGSTVVAAGGVAAINRDRLAQLGMLVPGAPINALAEEFRLIKRQLLNTARAMARETPERARTILVCSANPNEGKTYCSINLALSLAAERDTHVVLVDADFAKPDILKRLGLADRPGLLDVLADPARDVADHIVATDVPQLSLLPAGSKTHQDTELLASDRTRLLLDAMTAADPRRIIIFDSPPALAASPAATLAHHVGQVMMVVRADRTSDGDLRDAVGLLGGCDHIQLVLNAVSFAPGGRRFGSYYEQESLT